MYQKNALNLVLKGIIACLLALNLNMWINNPAISVLAETTIWPSETLYRQALSWEYNQKDYVHAAIYMYAYVQRNPPEYVNDPIRRDIVNRKLDAYLAETNNSIALLNIIKSNPNECEKYAGNQASTCNTFAEIPVPPPSDAALVCSKPNYQGGCRLLFVGDYSTLPSIGLQNDSIVSVMVGNRVKITLYNNSLGSSPFITLTSDDPDLGNNLFGDNNRYRWSLSVSSVRVQPR